MNTSVTSNKRRNLERLLRPRHVAYIGGKAAEGGITGCVDGGFDGPVWAVNPKYDSLGGQPCFDSVADLPEAPDATFIAVPRDATIDVVGQLADAGAGGAVCYAAGFSETGDAGAAHQAALIDAAGDLAAMGPNCFGFVNFVDRVGLWPSPFADRHIERGPAFIAQSGNVTINLMYNLRSVPFSYMISTGNEAVVGTNDFIEVLLDDPRVTAIGLYIEAIRDIAGFSQAAARALDQGVPIVALKAGRSEAARRVAMTHTGSLSGSEEAYAALFERLAISRADSPALLLEQLKALSIVGPIDGNRMTVFTCSGGEAALVSDLAERHGITLPQPTTAQYDKVREVLPDYANIVNPLDYNTAIWGQREPLEHVFTTMMAEGYDIALLVIDFLQRSGFEDSVYAGIESLIAARAATGVATFHTCSLSESVNADAQDLMIAAGVAPLQGLDHAITAIGAAVAHGKRRRDILANGGIAAVVLPPAGTAPDDAVALDEHDGKQRLAEFGLTVPGGRVATAATASDIADALGYPVVVKALSAAMHHKSEAGAVHLSLTSANAVRHAIAAMSEALDLDSFLVEPMISDGVCELIVGVTRDSALGMVLVIGGGGVLAEAMRDSIALLLPTNRAAVADALAGLKVATLLAGYRGKPASDVDAAIDAVLSVADFAEANRDRLAELDVNPLIVRPRGHGAVAVDALISIAD